MSSNNNTNDKTKHKRKRSDFTKLKVGDRMSETQYYEIIDVHPKYMKVRNERNFEFTVSKEIAEEGMYNANLFDETKKISRTALVGILENAKDTIFMVNFNKKPTESTVLSVLQACTIADFNDPKKLKSLATELTLGESRTLVGYLVHTEQKMGRSRVIDLEKPYGSNSRLVDHRTLNWMIYKGVKYQVK